MRGVFFSSDLLLDRLVENVVSMGSGTNRRRGLSVVAMMRGGERKDQGSGIDDSCGLDWVDARSYLAYVALARSLAVPVPVPVLCLRWRGRGGQKQVSNNSICLR